MKAAKRRVCVLAGLSLALGATQAVAQSPEPQLPVAAADSGYFPTLTEDILLQGPYDSRSQGGYNIEGPNLRAQTATDIFPYDQPTENFYQRYDSFFRPLDQTFGVLTAQDAIVFEGIEAEGHSLETALAIDANVRMFTRRFDPDLAHIKAGPLYFDLLWVGAGVVFSDFNGDRNFPDVDGGSAKDGWTGYVDIAARGLFRITDTIYISAIANLMYLPFENEVAFRMGNHNYPGIYTRLNIGNTVGEWDLLFFSQFRGVPGVDFYVDADSRAVDRAGRYYFGFYEDRTDEFYNDRQAYFVNHAGFRATRPVFDREWRFGFQIDRRDFWRTFSFEDHTNRDSLALWLQYEGSKIPFAPRIMYEYWTNDDFDSMWHRGMLYFTGRVTENVKWIGALGIGANTGAVSERVRWLWNIGLDHSITRSTRHWLRLGEDFTNNEVVNETITSRYLRYGIEQRITKDFHVDAFVQLSDREFTTRQMNIRDRVGAGLSLHYRPLDFTDLHASLLYDKMDQRVTTDDQSRWVWRFEWTQQLGHRLTSNVFYQYEEMDRLRRPFTEHLFGMSLRRYF